MTRSGAADPGPHRRSHVDGARATEQEASATQTADAGPSLTVAAVARRLGVAPATLRTWDRRYGLGPSERLAGSHRRYSTGDVARLLVMRRLTLEGVAPSEAARTALSAPQADPDTAPLAPSISQVAEAYSDAVPMAADPAALVAAAGHFDNAAVRWMLSRVQSRDTLAWWGDLVAPALSMLGSRVVVQGPGEHAVPALTSAAFAELRSRAAVSTSRSADAGGDQMRTVLAVPVGAGADLVVHVFATALQERGVRARVLASATPRAAAEVVSRTAPDAVVAVVDDVEGKDELAASLVEALVEVAPDLPVFVHSDSAAPSAVPVAATVHRVRSLTGALHEVLAVTG